MVETIEFLQNVLAVVGLVSLIVMMPVAAFVFVRAMYICYKIGKR